MTDEVDLFAAEAPPAPVLVCLRTEFMKERYGLPQDWRWHSFKVLDHKGRDPKDWEFSSYDGGVYTTRFARGKRKGRINFSKPQPGTERTCIVGDTEFKAWLPTWEAATGKCHQCFGTGQEWAGWKAASGDHYRDCRRCGATGIPPQADAQGVKP